MATTITIPSWKSFMYCEVHKVVKRKNGCIYKTEAIGFIPNERKHEFTSPDYVLASISTAKTKKDFITLEIIDSLK